MLRRIGAEEGGEFKAVASGTLPSGQPVVVNADGTVSVVSQTSVTEGVGSPVVFESSTTTFSSATYDANAQKVVIAYTDNINSSYGTAIVGTVSGTSISFGTAVVFESASSSNMSATYDTNAQKVVIAYTDVGGSEYGTAIVGTVSGTDISFGSSTRPSNFAQLVFFPGNGSRISIQHGPISFRLTMKFSIIFVFVPKMWEKCLPLTVSKSNVGNFEL